MAKLSNFSPMHDRELGEKNERAVLQRERGILASSIPTEKMPDSTCRGRHFAILKVRLKIDEFPSSEHGHDLGQTSSGFGSQTREKSDFERVMKPTPK